MGGPRAGALPILPLVAASSRGQRANLISFTLTLNSYKSLQFITEQEYPYNNFRAGFSLNFSLCNTHSEGILVYSIKLELLEFRDGRSIEFTQLFEQLSQPRPYFSTPIFVQGVRIHINPSEKKFQARWGSWDDSIDSRGATFEAMGDTARAKMLDFVQQIRSTNNRASEAGFELLPPSFRFRLEPSETDSFHCQLIGLEEGVYIVKFIVGYHIQGVKQTITSDQEYKFVSINWLERNPDIWHSFSQS